MLCYRQCTSRFQNQKCNKRCNTQECLFDGGDCKLPTEVKLVCTQLLNFMYIKVKIIIHAEHTHFLYVHVAYNPNTYEHMTSHSTHIHVHAHGKISKALVSVIMVIPLEVNRCPAG